jgi:transcriptional regulator with XRE-family HTH domain
MNDNALGTFLRQRREALGPEQVGLPRGGRRRTPGLRRSEVATLAGMSVEYLTRLEQGRDRNPSNQVLAALADTLQLSSAELTLLLQLGTIAGGEEVCPAVQAPDQEVRPAVRRMVAAMEPAAAAVVDRTGSVLAHTTAWVRLFEDVGLLDDPQLAPNLARFVFADPRARSVLPAWEVVADSLAAELGADNRRDDPAFHAFLTTLGDDGANELTARLAAGPTVARRTAVVRLVHPAVGELRLAYESMQVADSDQRLVVHLPHDEATARAIDELVLGRSGGLRAVPG